MCASAGLPAAAGHLIVIGSFNTAKAAEIAGLLQGLSVQVRPLSAYPHVRPLPEESGATFAENARLKALAFGRQLAGSPEVLGVVADDSGLEVDALGGRPGLRSARYVSDSATDAGRVQRILQELGDKDSPQKRTARFRCRVAFAQADRILLETEGTVEGRVSLAPAGTFGFGYDPIFIPTGYDKTFAELGPQAKHRISHRANALRRFRELLEEHLRREK